MSVQPYKQNRVVSAYAIKAGNCTEMVIRFHTRRSAWERFTVLTGACGTVSSRTRGEGRGSIGKPLQISFKDAILELILSEVVRGCLNSQRLSLSRYARLADIWGHVGGVQEAVHDCGHGIGYISGLITIFIADDVVKTGFCCFTRQLMFVTVASRQVQIEGSQPKS